MATQFEIDCSLMAGSAYIEQRAEINRFPTPAGWAVIADSHYYDPQPKGSETFSFLSQ